MALRARRNQGCRAASRRRSPAGTSRGLLTTSPSPGGLTVAASGVSTRGPSSAAARSERSSPDCGPETRSFALELSSVLSVLWRTLKLRRVFSGLELLGNGRHRLLSCHHVLSRTGKV